MSPALILLLLLAGLSEAVGRIMPLLVRHQGASPARVLPLLFTGAAVEGIVFALWPLTAWTLAELVLSAPSPGGATVWTPALAAPLALAAILAFPMLGPFLHLLLFVAVGATLSGPLAAAAGLDWGEAAGCLAAAGLALGLAVEGVRRLVIKLSRTHTPGVVT
ncbi:hypothetical protein [Streptomyces sp. ADI93-02]|uniref:hypothetical protein n=1 Tax=Streptomyces sp. ADI93-02 TaxID=1522757 RepID=UPI000F54FD69|nr:hypothetical protein [Streptomyces sp. ADI93-02]RPK32133.1 hypothetical protein EES40_36765 [Streptomyces sp. ADI93-02]